MKTPACLVTTLIAISLVGCATARVVTKYPNKGGVIAIPREDDSKSREKAEEMMRATCGGRGYQILKEGEAVVGSKATTETNVKRTPQKTEKKKFLGLEFEETTGGDNASSTTTTRNETEWRITYKCQ